MVEKKRKSSQVKTNERVTEQTPLTVGQYLAKIRTEQGHTIEDVSNAIHIRMAQLRAIEESRIGDLPGMTYALGFVRSYAQFLKLDINDIVNRFKLEHAVASAQKPDPEPVQEIEDDKRPDTPVMLAAGVAIVGLLIWAFWPQAETDPGTIEAQQIVAEIQEPPIDVDAPPPMVDAAPVVAEVKEQQPEPEVIKMTAAGKPPRILPIPRPAPAIPAAPETDVAAAAPSVETPVVAVAETVTPAAEEQPPEQTAATTAIVAPSAEIAPPAVETPAVVAADPVATKPDEVTLVPVAASAIPASLPTARPKIIPQNQVAATTSGAEASEQPIVVERPRGKIVIKAVATSWVEVTDAKDKTLFKKVMRPGDQYFVPDQKGLTLTTSNAGGIDLIVGGKKAPKIGRGGEIMNGIALNPERLLQKRIRTRD